MFNTEYREYSELEEYNSNQLYMMLLSVACQNQNINELKEILKKYNKHCSSKHFLNVLLKDSKIRGSDNVSNVLVEYGANEIK